MTGRMASRPTLCKLNVLWSRMFPWAAIGTSQAAIGFFVANDSPGLRVPPQAAAEFHGEIGHDAAGRCDMALLDGRNWPFAGLPSLHKVQQIAPVRRCGK